MKRWAFCLISGLALSALVLAGCGGQGGQQPAKDGKKADSGQAASKYEITWGTAPAGGAWQVLGTAMLEDVTKANPNLTGSTMPVGGAANIMGVHEGKLKVAFSLSATVGDAWEGKDFFKDKGQIKSIRALATLFPEPTQIVVMANSGIDSLEQLKGKKVSPGPKGSAVEQDTRRVLNAYGMSYNDLQAAFLSFEEAAQQMLDGHLDAICYGAMLYPAPNIVNVSSQKSIKMLSLSDDKIAAIVRDNKGTEPYTLPAGSYKGVDYPVKGIATTCLIICREDMPEDVAYSIVKTIAENFDRYATVTKAMTLAKKENMGKELGIPMHPGALKYYKEKGWVK